MQTIFVASVEIHVYTSWFPWHHRFVKAVQGGQRSSLWHWCITGWPQGCARVHVFSQWGGFTPQATGGIITLSPQKQDNSSKLTLGQVLQLPRWQGSIHLQFREHEKHIRADFFYTYIPILATGQESTTYHGTDVINVNAAFCGAFVPQATSFFVTLLFTTGIVCSSVQFYTIQFLFHETTATTNLKSKNEPKLTIDNWQKSQHLLLTSVVKGQGVHVPGWQTSLQVWFAPTGPHLRTCSQSSPQLGISSRQDFLESFSNVSLPQWQDWTISGLLGQISHSWLSSTWHVWLQLWLPHANAFWHGPPQEKVSWVPSQQSTVCLIWLMQPHFCTILTLQSWQGPLWQTCLHSWTLQLSRWSQVFRHNGTLPQRPFWLVLPHGQVLKQQKWEFNNSQSTRTQSECLSAAI